MRPETLLRQDERVNSPSVDLLRSCDEVSIREECLYVGWTRSTGERLGLPERFLELGAYNLALLGSTCCHAIEGMEDLVSGYLIHSVWLGRCNILLHLDNLQLVRGLRATRQTCME